MEGRVNLSDAALLPCKYGVLPGVGNVYVCYQPGEQQCNARNPQRSGHVCSRPVHTGDPVHGGHYWHTDRDTYDRWLDGSTVLWTKVNGVWKVYDGDGTDW